MQVDIECIAVVQRQFGFEELVEEFAGFVKVAAELKWVEAQELVVQSLKYFEPIVAEVVEQVEVDMDVDQEDKEFEVDTLEL